MIASTCSCIDNILINDLGMAEISDMYVIDMGISDHAAIYHSMSVNRHTHFTEPLCTGQIRWSEVILSAEAEIAFSQFYDVLMSLFYKEIS